MQDTVDIEVTPRVTRCDERVGVTVSGLSPNRRFVVRATTSDATGQRWQSEATFYADGDGMADLRSARPVAGTYERPDPMGLFWSMRPVDGADGSTSFVTRGEERLTVTLSVIVNGTVTETKRVKRYLNPPNVSTVHLNGDVVGTLTRPSGDRERPGIVVLGGSSGRRRDGAAMLLAARGYATLSLSYFRAEGLPRRLNRVPLSYVEDAIEWFTERDAVADRLGVIGWSKGGELALLLASRCDAVDAVIGYVPSSVVFQGIQQGFTDSAGSSWLVDGDEHPYVELNSGYRGILDFGVEYATSVYRRGPFRVRRLYERALKRTSADALEAASIPVEQSDAPILLVSGGDDQLWPSERLAEHAVARLERDDYQHPFAHVSYPGAGHGFRTPYLPTTERSLRRFFLPKPITFGGTPAAIADADADAWRRVVDFFRRHLGREAVESRRSDPGRA